MQDVTELNPVATPNVEELALVRRIAGGDHEAFELLMRRHNRRLYRLARSMLRNDAEAEDALQEAYLCAYGAIGCFRGEAALSTWLARLVLNECLARLRRHARRERLMPTQVPADDMELDAMAINDSETPEHAFARAQVRALLEHKLDGLPEVLRTVFVLRCVEEMSVEETALSLGIPEATVRSRHFRARKLLRKSLALDLASVQQEIYQFGGEHCDRVVTEVLARIAGAH
jgi:RNA polymerase sigma-70 factor, ECF subfamily